MKIIYARSIKLFFVFLCLFAGLLYVSDMVEHQRQVGEYQDIQNRDIQKSTRMLPGFCARCRTLQEDAEMEKCGMIVLDQSEWSFPMRENENKQVPAWFLPWHEYRRSFRILKVPFAGNDVELIQPEAFNPTKPRGRHHYYFSYLQNPDVERFGIANYSDYWRQDVSSSLFQRIKQYEEAHVAGKLQEEWKSRQKERFTKHHPWYQIQEYSLIEDYLTGNLSEAASGEWAILTDLTSTDEKLDKLGQQIPKFKYPYGIGVTIPLQLLMRKYENLVAIKRAVVLGSYSPWVELQVFLGGASHVTTVDYLRLPIPESHEHMEYLHPKELERRLSSGPSYDFAVSFSSLEHSGLGRYGDPYNPDGDLMEMARYSCIVKPGGLLFLGVPSGEDAVLYSLHRSYGPKRYTVLSECWKVVETQTVTFSGTNWMVNQPWLVLQNLRGCEVTLG